MSPNKWLNLVVVIALFAVVGWSPVQAVHAQAAPPSYQLQYLGPGTPVAMNNHGVVVGRLLISGTNNYQPLVSGNGSAWATLPAPAGAMSVFPTDINDSGVIVGVSFSPQWNPVAVRWTPSGGGYVLDEIPRLAGDASSYATAINNLGQVVGARRTLAYSPTGSGWLYSPDSGVVDLAAAYNWWSWPGKINDQGQIIAGAERLDLNTGSVTWIGAGPTNYNAIGAVDINNSGMMVGTASLRSSSLNIVSVFRYEGAAGWQFIDGSSKYATATSINAGGDIGYGELGAGVYLDGLGKFALGNLLDAAVRSAGWQITGSAPIINDQRLVATVGANSTSGQSGGVLLTPAGALPPPSAPANLRGVAHPATQSEPFNSINLSWENTSNLTQGYELERSVSPAGNWTRLTLTPPGTATNHTDTTVAAGVVYDYRVRAVGLGGASLWSAIATVTAPATPLDTTPPVVTIQSPANGAVVTGNVVITAQATDNVAVKYLEISYWNQYTGQQVILGSVNDAGSLSVSWNTGGMTAASYTLRAYAYDAIGNWSQHEISVTLSSSSSSMVVSSITLSGTVRQNVASITGDVIVKNSRGQLLSNATVAVRWTLPNGSTRTATALTGATGRARFTVSGSRGTYTLTVTNVTKSGYVFNAAGSVLTKSITK